MDSTRQALGLEDGQYAPTDWLGGWKTLFWSCGLLFLANLFLWVWDYKYAFTAGLNSASRDFTLHYRTLFWGELLTVGAFAGIWYGWLVRTGRALLNIDVVLRSDVSVAGSTAQVTERSTAPYRKF